MRLLGSGLVVLVMLIDGSMVVLGVVLVVEVVCWVLVVVGKV